jgi:hypothetical protein
MTHILKKVVLGVAVMLSQVPVCIAQDTEEELNLKYWTMRERFRRYFISIGKGQGQSIPAAKIASNANGGDRCFNGSEGWMSWGDATGYLSDYMCMLSTEYALLEKEGKSTNATLNELYYAINALDRLDAFAEPEFSQNNLPPDYNGFFLRDDITQSTLSHWNLEYSNTGSYDSRLNYQCLSSDHEGNLIGEVHVNGETNEPSFDQIVTIFQGFKFIQKYVPDVYVKPTPNDAGFNIVQKTKEIAIRIMDYASGADRHLKFPDHSTEYFYSVLNPGVNLLLSAGTSAVVSLGQCADGDVRSNWVLVNPVTGRKVGIHSSDTKGQDIRPFAWPLAKIGEQLTGNTYTDRDVHHEVIDQPGDGVACVEIHDYHMPLIFNKTHVWDAYEAGPHLDDEFVLIYYDEILLQKKPVCFKITKRDIPITPFKTINRNSYMLEVMGAVSGTWSHTNINKFANFYGHENMDLVYSCLNDKSPQNSRTHYLDLLSKLTCEGPHNYGTNDFTSFWNNGNSFEHPTYDDIDTESYNFGEYNANDWMWLYNMYRLKFNDDNSFPAYDDNSCNCKKSPVIEQNIDPVTSELMGNIIVKRVFPGYLKLGISLKEYITQILYINNKTLTNESELVICQGIVDVLNNGVLKNKNSAINDSVKIVVNETSSIVIHDNAELIVGTNSKVIIKRSANLLAYGANSKITVKSGAKLIIEPEGLLDIGLGTKLTVESGGMVIISPKAKFNMGNGSKLIVENGGQVIIQTDMNNPTANINGVLTFNAGAAIQLKGDNAVLELNGRLHIGDNAIFTFTYPGSNSGYIKFNRGNAWWDNWAPNNAHITCGTNAKIQLTGQSKTDKIVDIHQINVAIPKNLAVFNFSKGLVEFSVTDARLETDRPTFISNSTFKGTAFGNGPTTRGLLMFGQKLFYVTNSDFDALGYGIYGALFYMGNKFSNVKNCNFTNCAHAIEIVGTGYNILNNTFFNNSEAIITWDNTYNSLIRNNNISTNISLNPIVDPNHAANGAATSGVNIFGGTNAITELTKNTINNIDMAICLGNTEATLKCNDLQNNSLVLSANENSKTNMSDILGSGFNNASNSMQFACFYEANYFEADNGYNAFDLSDQNPCTTVYENPGHIAHTTCPVISSGSLVNFTTYNTTAGDPYYHYYETVAENNFWRPITGPQDAVIENEYNTIHKNDIYGNPMKARIVTGNALVDKTLVDCPFPRDGGGGNPNQPNLRVHPMDNNSNSTTITTASFYNKKLQAALKFSINKMDKLEQYDKVDEAAGLLTEILKANYVLPVKNPVDKYLLELSWQKLFACVAQLTEWERDSTGITTSLSAPLQAHFNDLHTIINLRISRKDLLEPDAKEVSDLIRLDRAMVYRLQEDRGHAIQEVNAILTSQPKNLHKAMYEELICLWNTENDALNGTISTDEAIARIKACNETYRPPFNNAGSSSQRMIAPVQENKITYAKEYAIAVYPNPTSGKISIAYSLQEFNTISFELFDIQGKKMIMASLNPEERQFNIEDLQLENGVYLYGITGDGKNLMTKKLVLVK